MKRAGATQPTWTEVCRRVLSETLSAPIINWACYQGTQPATRKSERTDIISACPATAAKRSHVDA